MFYTLFGVSTGHPNAKCSLPLHEIENLNRTQADEVFLLFSLRFLLNEKVERWEGQFALGCPAKEDKSLYLGPVTRDGLYGARLERIEHLLRTFRLRVPEIIVHPQPRQSRSLSQEVLQVFIIYLRHLV